MLEEFYARVDDAFVVEGGDADEQDGVSGESCVGDEPELGRLVYVLDWEVLVLS